MAVKFKAGKSYYVKHQDGMWDGYVKVLSVEADGCPRVIVSKILHGSERVKEYFDSFGEEGCVLGDTNWQQKQLNPTLENK